MKRGLIILIGGLLVACAGYCLFYYAGTAAHRKVLAGKVPELLWLKKEFKLSDTELAHVTQLHEAYLPACVERCKQIDELNRKVVQAVGSASQLTPEIEQLLTERARVRTACQAAMLKPGCAGQRILHGCARVVAADEVRWQRRMKECSNK